MMCDMDQVLFTERPRLVKLCARFIGGNLTIAEDLAQETLLRAWDHRYELRDEQRVQQWLNGIARNVCLMWIRCQKSELTSSLSRQLSDEVADADGEEHLASDFDLELELERKDLVTLLERALALLPAETRALLIARYVQDAPMHEIAARQGIDPATVAKRLQRGKTAFRHVLTQDLYQEMAPYLNGMQGKQWDDTRIWCFFCGQHYLKARFIPGFLLYRCPHCHSDYPDNIAYHHILYDGPAMHGARWHKQMLLNVTEWNEHLYHPYLASRELPCPGCGRWLPITRTEDACIQVDCHRCNLRLHEPADFLMRMLAETRHFWRQHPRMRLLPFREIEIDGVHALLSGYEDVTSEERIEIALASDTLALVRVFENGHMIRSRE